MATVWGTALFAVLATAARPAEPLKFDRVFDPRGEPAQLRYTAAFTSGGADHRLSVWRDGDRRVKRVTDEALETYAVRKPGEAAFHMDVLDRRKHIHTRIDRTNLYRVGAFIDWFDLTHGLRHPKGIYQLATGSAPTAALKPLCPCRWYDLTQGGRAVHVCWSREVRLPLLIVSAEGRTMWRITALDRRPIPPATFKIHDAGYVRNDANRDIESD